MKINKNSWHYRLVLKQVEEHRFDLLWSGKMPETRCRYFAILLWVIFPYAWYLGLIAVFFLGLIINPMGVAYFFAIFALLLVISVVITILGYGSYFLYKKYEKPLKQWLKQYKDKICAKIEYV